MADNPYQQSPPGAGPSQQPPAPQVQPPPPQHGPPPGYAQPGPYAQPHPYAPPGAYPPQGPVPPGGYAPPGYVPPGGYGPPGAVPPGGYAPPGYMPPGAYGQPWPMSPAQAQRQQVLASVEIASPWSRLGARIIDNVLYALPLSFMAVAKAMGVEDPANGAPAAVAWLGVAVMMGLQAFFIGTTSKSIGKRLLGLKMIRHNGEDAGFVHGWLVRSFAFGFLEWFVNLMLLFVPGLVDALMIFSENGQTLHDRIASTYVIVDR